MRLGIIAAAGAEPASEPQLGERDAGLVRERLVLDDLGYRIHIVDPSLDLAEQLDETLAALTAEAGNPPEVLFYASCLLAVVEDGECFLCLDPSEPDVGDSLRDVVAVLAECAGPSLIVLDARYDDPEANGATMRAIMDAVLDCVDGRVELIAAVRPRDCHPERMPSRLTAALLEAIDTHEPTTLTARQAYAIAVQQADLGSWPHAASYAPGLDVFAMRGTLASEPAPASGAHRPTDPDGTRLEEEEPPPPPTPIPAPVSDAPPAAEIPPPPPAPVEPEAPMRPYRSIDRRPAPPSERKQATVTSVPARKQPKSAAEPLPKVVLSPSSRPSDSSHPPPRSEAESSEPPPSSRRRGRRRHRPPELFDTNPGAPEAKRSAAARGEPSSFDEGFEDFGEAEEPAAAAPRAEEASEPPPAREDRPQRKLADMTVEDHVAEGDAAQERGDLEEAAGQYKHALGKLGTATVPLRAEIYVRLGELSRIQGKRRVAISNFDKALTIAPGDLRALEALIELNAADGNWRAVLSAEERFFAAPLEDEVCFEHLIASGLRWREDARDEKRARERFQQSRTLFPERPEPIEGLLEIYRAEGNVEQVIELRRHLAEIADEPDERARRWFALGEYCLFEARRDREGMAAFEEALEADPTMLEALEVLATALAEVQEWAELERVYGKMIARFEKRELDEATENVLVELHRRMALLHRDHLEDPASAIEELDKELAIRPEQLSGQLLGAEIAGELGDQERAMRYLRRAAWLDPERSETYHQLFVAARRADDVECAYLAASVAVDMGAADERERIVYKEHRLGAPPPHRRPIPQRSWEWLRYARRDENVERIMHAIAPAVLRHRVRQLDEAGALPRLPDSGPHDPEKSTVSAIRSVAWAAEYLGLNCPDLYAGEELAGGFSAPFSWRPTTFIGREVLSGKTLLELAFMAGRHLALRVPEHELVAHLTSIDELTACFLASLHIVLGAAPDKGKLGRAAAALARQLERQMEGDELEVLEDAVRTFSESGGRADLKKWVAAVEICASRAGYLMCGDLETAVRVVRAEPGSFASSDRLVRDLRAFTVSDEHLALREELGSALDAEDEAMHG